MSQFPERPEAAAVPPGETLTWHGPIDLADPRSPLARCYLCRRQVGFVGCLLVPAAVFVLLTFTPLWHTDVWGHLRYGEAIVTHRRLPEREPFSGDFVDPDAVYVNFQWLSQAALYVTFDTGRRLAAADFEHALGGGALLLSTLHALVVALRLLVLLLAFHRLTDSWGFALAGVLLATAMSVVSHLFVLRPQVFGELAFALVLLTLSRPLLSRRALVGLPLLFVIWVNTHGSFAVGLVLLVLALLGRCLSAAIDWRRGESPATALPPWRDPQVRRLTLVLLLCLVATLLNPHGFSLYRHSLELASHPNLQYVGEWRPLPLTRLPGGVFLVSLGLLVLLGVASPRRYTATQFLLLAFFGWQTLAHGRMFVWWIMVWAWTATPQLQAVWRRFLPSRSEDAPDLRKTTVAGMLLMLMCLLVLCAPPVQWLCFGRAPLGVRRVTVLTPVAAAHFLRAQYQQDREGQLRRGIFTSETLGDYLLWDLRLEPPVRLNCYSHLHLFQPEHWRDCVRVLAGHPGWQEVLDRQGVQFLVLEPDRNPGERGAGSLIDQVRAAPDRWEVVAERPIFVARRLGACPGRP